MKMKKRLTAKQQKEFDAQFNESQMRAESFQACGGELGWNVRNYDDTLEQTIEKIKAILKHEAGPLWGREPGAPPGQPKSIEAQMFAMKNATPKQFSAVGMICEVNRLNKAVKNTDYPRELIARWGLEIGAKLMRLAADDEGGQLEKQFQKIYPELYQVAWRGAKDGVKPRSSRKDRL